MRRFATEISLILCTLLLAMGAAFAVGISPRVEPAVAVTQDDHVHTPMCALTPYAGAAIKPGVSPEEAQWAMDVLLEQALAEGGNEGARFQPFAGRWGPENEAGSTEALTYSFPADGLMVDGNINNGGDIQPNVLHSRLGTLFGSEATWKQYFRDMFDDWSATTGNVYTEVTDDNAAWGTSGPFHGNNGRGDIRIVMAQVTPTTFFAFNFFPENGDMVIDSVWPWGRFGGNLPEWRNMLAHEHGHGIGLFHSCPQNGQKLMEPLVNTGFFGPQFDDKLGGQALYGDRFEPNGVPGGAVDLPLMGLTNNGIPVVVQEMSLQASDDVDLLKVESLGGTTLTVGLSPVGATYIQGPQTGACDAGSTFVPSEMGDLVLEIQRPNFSIALTVDANPVGAGESVLNFDMDDAGTWLIRVRSTGSFGAAPQMYDISVSTNGGGMVGSPVDFSADGCVDSVDLAILLAGWGGPSTDVSGDGVTNSVDLAILLAAWTGSDCLP